MSTVVTLSSNNTPFNVNNLFFSTSIVPVLSLLSELVNVILSIAYSVLLSETVFFLLISIVRGFFNFKYPSGAFVSVSVYLSTLFKLSVDISLVYVLVFPSLSTAPPLSNRFSCLFCSVKENVAPVKFPFELTFLALILYSPVG